MLLKLQFDKSGCVKWDLLHLLENVLPLTPSLILTLTLKRNNGFGLT